MDTPLQKIAEKLRGGVLFLYEKLIKPRSPSEDTQRQEFILNILLVASIAFALLNLLIILYSFVVLDKQMHASSGYIIRFLLLFFFGFFSSLPYKIFSSVTKMGHSF